MDCSRCKKKAVMSDPVLCKEHFLEYYEDKVKECINDYKLLSKKDKVCVATSGGKDSLTVLFILHKLGYDTTALFIDEGIADYRQHTQVDLEKFCKEHNIKLKIVSFKEEFGKTLDEILRLHKVWKPCTVCGTLRRYLLNKHSKGFDRIVTGHNLDDEAQAVVMNFLRSNLDFSARLGPKSGIKEQKGFTQRVKPLYFCTEKETATYSFLHDFTSHFTECPYVVDAYRAVVRDLLNDIELNKSGTKRNIIKSFLKMLPGLQKQHSQGIINSCTNCGEPATRDLCNTCVFVGQL